MSNKLIITLDTSQVKEFDFCPLAWAYRYKESILLAGTDASRLEKGILMHLLLELYYKERANNPSKDLWDCASEATKQFATYKEVYNYPDIQVLKFITKRFSDYLGFWQENDLVPSIRNGVPGVEVGFSKIIYETEDRIYILEGKIDFIDHIENYLCITDHKTQAKATNLYTYRPQMLSYAMASGARFGRINYIGLQETVNKSTFRRDTMEFPDWMLDRWHNYLIHQVFDKIAEGIILQTASGLANENIWRKQLTSCAGAFESHPCQYTGLCETANLEMLQNKKRFSYIKVDPWIPWRIEVKKEN